MATNTVAELRLATDVLEAIYGAADILINFSTNAAEEAGREPAAFQMHAITAMAQRIAMLTEIALGRDFEQVLISHVLDDAALDERPEESHGRVLAFKAD